MPSISVFAALLALIVPAGGDEAFPLRVRPTSLRRGPVSHPSAVLELRLERPLAPPARIVLADSSGVSFAAFTPRRNAAGEVLLAGVPLPRGARRGASAIAFGMTLVIVTGGIDLSVGSLVALTGVVAAIAMRAVIGWGAPAAILVGLLAGTGAGAVAVGATGWIVTRFVLPPFLVTLAAMLVAPGFAFILCGGQPIYEGLPAGLVALGRGFVLEDVLGRVLPVPVLIMLIGFAAFHVLLARTVLGRSIVAVGSNEEAARLAGIPVVRTRRVVYALTGALSGLVGVLHTGKLMAADPKVGAMWELNVIAAVVVGGTSLLGGRGGIPGTLVGALVIGVLNNSLNLLHVEHFWQQVVLGLVILAAALLDAALSRLGRSAI